MTNINEEQILQILENFLEKRKWKIDILLKRDNFYKKSPSN